MKQLIFIIFLAISTSCTSNTQAKADTDNSDTIKVTLKDTVYPKNSRFNELRKESKGEIIDEKIWQQNADTFITILSKEHIVEKEFGGVFINHWKLGKEPKLLWEFSDTLNGGEGDLVVSYDLDSLIVEDVDSDKVKDIVIIYTLDWAYDVSSMKRFLVVLDKNGKQKIKLQGWTLEPTDPANITAIDFKYNPKTDSDLNQQGKIKNFNLLDKTSKKTSNRLIEFWKKVLEKDKKVSEANNRN